MADIKKELNDIKTAIYGRDVRGSIHDGIDKINKESENSKQKADEAHDVMESIINDGFDNAALEANFEQKLDDKIGQLQPEWTQFQTDVTSQLNDTNKQLNKETHSIRKFKAKVGIIDDDGRNEILDTWLPLLNSHDFKLDIAIITGMVGNSGYLDWSELDDLVDNHKVRLLNHSHTHPNLNELSENELRLELENSLSEFSRRGYTNGDILVYPRGNSNHDTRKVVSEYFRAAFFDTGGTNYAPLNTYNLRRVNIFNGADSMADLETLKAQVDNAIDNDGWLVFISHSQFAGFDINVVGNLIDYINSKVDEGLIDWAHANEALDEIGNIIHIGDNEDRYENGVPESVSYPYRIVDANGCIHSNISDEIYKLGSNTVDFNTPVTKFPRDKFSYGYITSSNPTINDFPGGPGILEVFHANSPIFSYQTYKPSNSSDIYLRRWSTDGWKEFDRISNLDVDVDGTRFDSPVTYFKSNRVSYSIIGSANPSISEFPEGIGILKTVRIGSTSFAYQQYKPSTSNKMYQRSWRGSSWGEFESIGGEIANNENANFNTPPSEFKAGMITNTPITTSNSANFPEGPGLLLTYRFGPYAYAYQTYKPNDSTKLYIRNSNGSGSAWGNFA